MILEMLLAALLPIRDACPLYYPQKSAEPAPTKRLRAFLGTEAALGAAVARLHAGGRCLEVPFEHATGTGDAVYAVYRKWGV